MNEPIKLLQQYINEANNIVFFGGAGVSTESGLPDYRSAEGVYTTMENENIDPKKLMSKRFMMEKPEVFFSHRFQAETPLKPKPNAAHQYLAALEKSGKSIQIITQNVDGLHYKAGSTNVVELHGNHRRFYCMTCGTEYAYETIHRDEQNIPRCPLDNGIVRADVILFGENLKPENLVKSKQLISAADLLIIAGTSLTVNPAKNLINQFKGNKVVVINKSALEMNLTADLFIKDAVGTTFSQLTI
ncbi:NAD-dependent protein deacylase [Carnobacterium pleistocenium]|uniref:NAD-dependent protein deacylase n=1 Tax=Carnobacterium pleistocenium TaxID=181073 RepID=UPI000557AB4E|nr:NAD-dependent protein deacylase [Carnobacterium pleistocenium]